MDDEKWHYGQRPRKHSVHLGEPCHRCRQRGAIVVSEDGGQTWEEVDTDIWDNIRNVFFISDKEGWLIGERNMIAHTTDGGRTWDRQYAGAEHMLNGVYFVTREKGLGGR